MFPSSTPSFTTPTSSETLAAGGHTNLHVTEEANIIALANKLGLGASTPANNTVLRATGVGTTTYDQVHLATDVSGVLPVSNGGSGTSSSTGTGSNVLNNSPTLITPTENNGTYNSPIINTPVISGYPNNSIPAAAIVNNSLGTSELANQAVTPNILNLVPTTGVPTINTTGTTTSTSITGTLTGLTPVACTVTIGANGLLLVGMASQMSNSTTDLTTMFFALSGTNTQAATDAHAISYQSFAGSSVGQQGAVWLLTGLSPGSTTITPQFLVSGGTGSFVNPIVWGLPL